MKRAAFHTARTLSRFIDKFILLCSLIVLLFGLYIMLDVGYVYYNSSTNPPAFMKAIYREQEPIYTMDDLGDDCVAWLKMDGTTIDYPIMFDAKSNNTFLNKGPTGKYNLAGSIFLDHRNDPDFSDNYSLLYGHHMANGYMFGALDAYEDPDYMFQHQTGTLTLRNGTVYDLFVFAFSAIDATTEEVFTPSEMHDINNFISENTIYNGDHNDTPTLALSTCRTPGETMRTVVFCDMIPRI